MESPLPPDVSAALSKLQYDRLWLDSGVLTIETLWSQSSEFDKGEDQGTEHYRYAVVKALLWKASEFDDATLDQIMLLLRIDPDQVMATSVRAHFLLPHPGLTDEQFERIANLPEVQHRSPREAWRARLLRRLAAGEWSPQFVDLCLAHGDSTVQRELLDHPRLDRPALLALAERGANKPIRNRATFLLATPRFRSAPGAGPAVAR